MTCYARVGQHSGACLDYYRSTKAAKPSPALDSLRAELVARGYKLAERKRLTPAMTKTRRARAVDICKARGLDY